MEHIGGLLGLLLGLVVIAAVSHHLHNATADGRLQRNSMFGVRTKATMASDEAWRLAHTTALPWLRAATCVAWIGTAATVAALLTIAFTAPPVVAMPLAVGFTAAALGFVGSVAMLLIGGLRGDRAARAAGRHDPSAEPGTGER